MVSHSNGIKSQFFKQLPQLSDLHRILQVSKVDEAGFQLGSGKEDGSFLPRVGNVEVNGDELFFAGFYHEGIYVCGELLYLF